MSRPKRPVKFHLRNVLRVCLTDADRSLLDKAALAKGLNTSTWARAELLRLATDILAKK